MTVPEYLEAVLKSQTLEEGSAELADLRQHRDDVEKLLRTKFADSSPTIRYGGSKAKGTMNREGYDLDIISYFESGDTSAGESLEEIYNEVAGALEGDYYVERKSSALRLKAKDQVDFHIDVVPGRFTDDTKTDAYLYVSTGEKKRLKTNLQTHVDHVKDSGVIDALRLVKLWRVRNVLLVRNFVLELIAIDILVGKKKESLDVQMEHFFKEVVAQAESIAVKDPANPEGNDLSGLLSDAVRSELKSLANVALGFIESSNWEGIFGAIPEVASATAKRDLIREAVTAVSAPSKPWLK